MKVKDVVKKLSEFDPEMEAVTTDCCYGYSHEIAIFEGEECEYDFDLGISVDKKVLLIS